jgi:uncharacterized membrane protein
MTKNRKKNADILSQSYAGEMVMRTSSYVTGILVKLLAIILMITGFLLFVYSTDMLQEAPAALYWLASWAIFIVGLIMFITAVVAQRRALRRISRMRDVRA